ncbi:MAG: 30S ribosomal protein S12 methylthiotransferase RimO [Fusobacterium sp.]|nr:30S ribosomal protein S12 methylthiotransferase RimO [Fusobacterium sp.]
MKIALVNHGCPKNLVDSELMLGVLVKSGFEVTLDDREADFVIVNTCSFIHDAEKESVQSILQLVDAGKKVIVTGCLAQKHKEELKEAIPEIVGVLGISEVGEIDKLIKDIIEKDDYAQRVSQEPKYCFPKNVERQQITMGASSYLKISEGCNCSCGYCIIPKLRGKQVSRPVEDIIDEAKKLVAKGVTEIILIAQDTTSYGIDLYGEYKLAYLLRELNKIEGLGWIRIMYAYPSFVTDELLFAMRDCEKVVKYLDLPLQHFDKDVLISMKRPAMDYDELIAKIRSIVPNIAIRTTFIVGYPMETDEQFNALHEFVKRAKFERLGVFEYCREKGTYSYSLKPQIAKKVKHERFKKIMQTQKEISLEKNMSRIGDVMPCIIEAITDDNVLVMRSEYDAPEIDGLVYANSESDFCPGDIVMVKITKTDEYDLFGEVLESEE